MSWRYTGMVTVAHGTHAHLRHQSRTATVMERMCPLAVLREDIHEDPELLETPLVDHIANCITALRGAPS